MSDKVLKESYVERFARELREAGEKHEDSRGEGQEATKEKRRRKQAGVGKESDHK